MSKHVQAIGVHGLAGVEFEVLEIRQELLLDVGLGTLLESRDIFGGSIFLLHASLDSLHIA